MVGTRLPTIIKSKVQIGKFGTIGTKNRNQPNDKLRTRTVIYVQVLRKDTAKL